MASETKILEAIFGQSIPTEKAAVLPDIMSHIKAIDALLQGKTHRQAHQRISDPAISGPINSRIEELYAEQGKEWPKIAAAICQEFGVTISPDACRGRHKDAMARKEAAIPQEGYAALSGQAIQAGIYTTPKDAMQVAAKEEPAEPVVDPKPAEQVATRPFNQQLDAMKAEAIRRHNAGEDVKAIAKALGVRWQWVRAVCAHPGSHKSPSATPEEPATSPEPPEAPLTPMDAMILELLEENATVYEICLAIGRNFHLNLSAREMAEKIRTLQGGANGS